MNRVKLPGKWVQVRMKTRPRTPKWKGGGGGAGVRGGRGRTEKAFS